MSSKLSRGSVAAAFRRLAASLAPAFEELHRIQFDAPWKAPTRC